MGKQQNVKLVSLVALSNSERALVIAVDIFPKTQIQKCSKKVEVLELLADGIKVQ